MLGPNPYHAVAPRAPQGPLVYELPAIPSQPNLELAGPLVPVGRRALPLPAPRCDAALYRLGMDEGTTQWMFSLSPLAEKDRWDGLLVIRIRVLLEFESKDPFEAFLFMAGVNHVFEEQRFNLADPPPYGAIYRNVLKIVPNATPTTPADAPPFLRRIAVVVHAEYDFVSLYADHNPPRPLPTDANLWLRVLKSAPPHALLANPIPSLLHVAPDQVLDIPFLRYALGLPTYVERVPGDATTRDLITTIDQRDLQPIADAVSRFLRDPPGTGRVGGLA